MVPISWIGWSKTYLRMRPSSDRSAILRGALMWLQNWIADGESALRLRTDLPYFAEHCLKLRTKSGAVEPFILNLAQLRLHALLEEQRVKTGRVRAVILKAR